MPYSGEILNALNNCRFDKIKPVREATLESIKLIKELVAEHPHLQTSQHTMSQEVTVDQHMMTNTTVSDKILMRGSGSRRVLQSGGGQLQPEIIRDRSNGTRSARPRESRPKSPLGNSITGSMVGYDQDHTRKVESVRQSFTANQKVTNSAHNKNKSASQIKQVENQKA